MRNNGWLVFYSDSLAYQSGVFYIRLPSSSAVLPAAYLPCKTHCCLWPIWWRYYGWPCNRLAVQNSARLGITVPSALCGWSTVFPYRRSMRGGRRRSWRLSQRRLAGVKRLYRLCGIRYAGYNLDSEKPVSYWHASVNTIKQKLTILINSSWLSILMHVTILVTYLSDLIVVMISVFTADYISSISQILCGRICVVNGGSEISGWLALGCSAGLNGQYQYLANVSQLLISNEIH